MRGMDNGGLLFLAGALIMGAGVYLAHHVGYKAGWCDGYTEAVADSWEDYDKLTANADQYGESKN